MEEKVTWIVISESVFWYSYSTSDIDTVPPMNFSGGSEQFTVSITLEGMENC